jgi:hypothetical protein
MSIVTEEAVASYANVFSPRETPNGDMKYSISLLFPKESTDMSALKEAIQGAIVDKWGEKPPKDLRIPVRDGDTKEQEAYHGHWFINANANEDRRPKVVGPDLKPIIDADQFYSGCICRAELHFYGYDTAGNQGVGAGLNSLMKVRDGEPLGNVSDPEKTFASFAKKTSNNDTLDF